MEQPVNLSAPPHPQPLMINMNVANTTTTPPATVQTATTTTTTVATAATATTTPGSTEGSLDLFAKKKRGRPRKYDADGNLNPAYKKSATPPQRFTLSATANEFSAKRGRGKPATGFGNYHLFASFGEVFASSASGDFTPHVVTVYTGEDVAGKIMSFAQKSPRGICILSANGPISNVTLRQPGSCGGILTYEGRFEILSLSGSFSVSDSSGMKSRSAGLSVSLAGPDGRVIGGGVAGLLTAAGPIQIVVGSFMPNGYLKTHKRKYQREHTVASPTSTGPETVTGATPISQANSDGENYMIPMTQSQIPLQIQRESVSVPSDKQSLDGTPDAAANWNGSEEYSDQRTSPDINISLSDE
ncbi:AT-hook motif nuclear-localized protein 1-like [Lotus japonicus]|uniref:AT-hook motif nuclear-localized protein 1-like n=1 Tax=Lotus japonicus TaxID=34305 RepID=UPI00258EC9C6|nr:AT-hook motif nuclear-localized protein 1-like [Lotus japonicus]